jgi:hypothetical protein
VCAALLARAPSPPPAHPLQQALFGSAFSTPVNVEVSFTNVGDRKYRDVLAAASGLPHRVYIFSDGDDVCGDVKVGVGGGKRLDHVGVKVELKGVIGERERGRPAGGTQG